MLTVVYTNQMKHDIKCMKKRGKDISKLHDVLKLLAQRKKLQKKYRDHQLKGEKAAYRECHIESNWLLIYRIIESKLFLLAAGTGTHSDIFNE